MASSSSQIKERAKACSQDAKHVFHKERLEYQQAEYEARNVLDAIGNPSRLVMAAATMMPVASPAMQ